MATGDQHDDSHNNWLVRSTDRRGFLRDAARAGLGIAGLAAVGCGQQQPPPGPAKPADGAKPAGPAPAPQSAPSGKPTGRVVYGITAVANSLDPAFQQTAPSITPYHGLWDLPVRLDTFTGKVEPGVAESWQAVDGQTVEFKLRRGIKFSNGRELIADDVKFSLERLLDPQNKGIVGNLVRELAHVDVVDSHTFRVVAKGPNPTIPLIMTRVFILPAAEVKAAGSLDAFFANPIGSGPFKLKEFGRESFVELVASETSWRQPRVSEIRFQGITEDGARIAALQSGQADLIDGVPPDQLQGLQNAGYKVEVANLAANYAIDLFGPPDSPHAKLEVRQALAHAIDWATIHKEILRGTGRLSNGLIGGPGCAGWADDPVKYPYDPNKAKQLLAQAGYPNGFKTKFMSSRVIMTGAVQIAEAIASFLKEVKVETELTLLDAATNLQFFLSTYDKGRAPLWIFRHSYDLRMDVAYQLVFYDEKQSIHKYGWNNAQFDTTLANASKELDAKKREQLLLDANRLMRDNAITVTGFQPPYIVVHSAKLSGVKARPDGLVWIDDLAKA